ncbi:MAG TPA: hypothetical protein DEV93_02595 [Chloroflexi bacterium]|jgi:hypothetical protein|nr:hypothetical protein [Chloroflexota bacterium]
MTVVPTFGWETLGPHLGGRRLVDRDERFQVSAKVRTHGPYEGWMFAKVWSSEAGWSHIALDPNHAIEAQGCAGKEKDSWQMCRDILAAKKIGAARADLS